METNDSCGRIQATGKEKKGFAMLIDVGTICLILSDREGCSSRGGKEKRESRENRRYDRRLQKKG